MSKKLKKKYKKMKHRLREATHTMADLMLITKSIFDSSYIEKIEEANGEYHIEFQDHTGVAIPVDNDGTKEGIMLNLLYGVLAQIYHSEEMADGVFEFIERGAEVLCDLPESEEEIYERFSSSASPEATEDTETSDNTSENTSFSQSQIKKLTQNNNDKGE